MNTTATHTHRAYFTVGNHVTAANRELDFTCDDDNRDAVRDAAEAAIAQVFPVGVNYQYSVAL